MVNLLIPIVGGILAASLTMSAAPWIARTMRNRRLIRRIAAGVGIVILSSSTVLTGEAWASSQSADNDFSNFGVDNQTCAHAHVYINNTSASPHLDAYGASWTTFTYNNGLFCNDNSGYNEPGGWLRTREDLYVYSYYYNKFVPCNYGPFIYNAPNTYRIGTGWNPNRPCGGGTWYFDSGYGAFYWGGTGQWIGGWVQTPNAVYVS